MHTEFKELQEIIESIAVTAKLMNYKVGRFKKVTIIFKNNLPIFMMFSLDESSLTTTYRGGNKKIFTKDNSHEEKIGHLQQLLQRL